MVAVDLIDLNDCGLAARAEGKDRSRDRLGVAALVRRHDPVIGLRRIEVGRELFKLLAELSRHRMPPHDLCGGLRGRRERRRGKRYELQEFQGQFHR